jgi:L-methionine (R)-S-oxide reductase
VPAYSRCRPGRWLRGGAAVVAQRRNRHRFAIERGSGNCFGRATIMDDVDRLIERLDGLRLEGAAFEALLEAAVTGLHLLNPLFHWTGIYELFPDDVLRLGPFIGSPTDHVFIGVGQGVCGTAIAERRNLNIPDVRKVSNYLACSSETRSELVVLIRQGETIYAQIDIDSHEVAAFDDGVVSAVQRVADWLAPVFAEREHRAAS